MTGGLLALLILTGSRPDSDRQDGDRRAAAKRVVVERLGRFTGFSTRAFTSAAFVDAIDTGIREGDGGGHSAQVCITRENVQVGVEWGPHLKV